MNQDEHNAKNVADLAKLQAIKETTERFLHLGEGNTHSLIVLETIRKGEENETITGVVTMIEGAWLIMNDNKQLASYLWSETDKNEVIGNIYKNPELLEE